MRKPTSAQAKTARNWGRGRAKRLLGRRRPQLLFAVLLGVIIGGGFTAVASAGGPGYDHDGRVEMSSSSTANGPGGNFDGPSGYDHHHG